MVKDPPATKLPSDKKKAASKRRWEKWQAKTKPGSIKLKNTLPQTPVKGKGVQLGILPKFEMPPADEKGGPLAQVDSTFLPVPWIKPVGLKTQDSDSESQVSVKQENQETPPNKKGKGKRKGKDKGKDKGQSKGKSKSKSKSK